MLPASTPDTFRVKRHSDLARIPTQGSSQAAGYNLYSAELRVIPAQGKALIDTQLSIRVPPGTYGRIAPRSGLAVKFDIATRAGVIDPDYRGVVHVLLFNLGDQDFQVNVGDRVVQLILERVATPNVSEVIDLDDSPSTSSSPPLT